VGETWRHFLEHLRPVNVLRLARQPLNAIIGVGLTMAGLTLVVQVVLSAHLPPIDRGLVALFLEVSVLVSLLLRRGQDEPIMASIILSTKDKYVFGISRLPEAAPYLLLGMTVAGALALTGETRIALFVSAMAGLLVFDLALSASRIHAIAGYPRMFAVLSLASLAPLFVVAVINFAGISTGVTPWLVAYAFPGLLVAMFYFWLSRHGNWSTFLKEQESVRLELRNAGLALLPGQLSGFFSVRIERFLIPLLHGPESLGIYVAVAGLMDGVLGPLRAWIDSSLTRWRLVPETKTRKKTFVTSLTVIAILSTFVAPIAVFAQILVSYVFPESYREASQLIPPLAISTVLVGGYLFHRGHLLAGKHFAAARNGDLLLLFALALSSVLALLFGELLSLAWTRVAVFGMMLVISGLVVSAPKKPGSHSKRGR